MAIRKCMLPQVQNLTQMAKIKDGSSSSIENQNCQPTY